MSLNSNKCIFILHRGGGTIRGTEVCLISAAEAFFKAGYRLVLFRNNQIIDQEIQPYVLEIVDFDYPEIMIGFSNYSLPLHKYLTSLFLLLKYIKAYLPTVIYCSGGLPCQLAVPMAKLRKIPVVCHFHHPATKRYILFWLVKYVDEIFVPSLFTGLNVKERIARQSIIIPNGVNLESRYIPAQTRDRSFRQKYCIKDTSIVVGQVGHLTPHKRPDFLLEAFCIAKKSEPNLHLCLVGNGPMQQELEAKIEKNDLRDCVTLTGYVPDVLPYYQNVFDINVLASKEEGLGISIIEASGCELPSIVTDCTGLREVVQNDITGFKFEQNNIVELVNFLLRLATCPRERIDKGKAARKFALDHFTLITYQQKITQEISKLIMSHHQKLHS